MKVSLCSTSMKPAKSIFSVDHSLSLHEVPVRSGRKTCIFTLSGPQLWTSMAKFHSNSKRPNVKESKNKRWKKGQSSSSNPSTKKHREAAKHRFFQAPAGQYLFI